MGVVSFQPVRGEFLSQKFLTFPGLISTGRWRKMETLVGPPLYCTVYSVMISDSCH